MKLPSPDSYPRWGHVGNNCRGQVGMCCGLIYQTAKHHMEIFYSVPEIVDRIKKKKGDTFRGWDKDT